MSNQPHATPLHLRTRSLSVGLVRLTMCAFALLHASTTAHADDGVATAKVVRTATIDAPRDRSAGERIVADAARGSFEFVVDPAIDVPRIEAEFTVDGKDAKDVERRSELVRLFAERVPDQSVVVQPIFPGPGKPMERDSVRVRIIVPKAGDSSLRTAKGDVSASGTAGRLRLTTKDGAIRVERHSGPLQVAGTEGAIELLQITGETRASSAGGSITLVLADGNDLPFNLDAKAGAIRVEVGVDFDGSVLMHSTGGRIDVGDPGQRSRTPQQGDFTRTVEIGAAAGHSEVRTTTGAIRLSIRPK